MKKKILALVLVISFVISMFALSFTTSAASTLKGDADGNGELSTNDALLVLRAAAGIEDSLSAEAKTLCDVDGDGYISLFDARRILRAAAGLINLEQTGKFKGYTDYDKIFEGGQEEALTFFNTNLNKVKSEKFGFTAYEQADMIDFDAKITIAGQEAQNTVSLINGIFGAISQEPGDGVTVPYNATTGNTALKTMSIQGKSYVTKLANQDIYGMKVEYDPTIHPENGGVITITIAIPDSEKCDIFDSSYTKVLDTDKLISSTDTAINKLFSNASNGTEVVYYKNAVLVAEFEKDTGYVTDYSISYETSVYIEKATRSLYSLENVNYKTENKVWYEGFIYD